MAFGANLRRIREEQFLSQAELANRSGVRKLTIQRLESGATAPLARTVRRLANALGVDPGELASAQEVAERIAKRKRQKAQ